MDRSIRYSYHRCLSQFHELLAHIDRSDGAITSQMSLQAMEDEMGRLKVWAGNLGAYQLGSASLDYRLREASHIKSQIVKMLQYLTQNLNDGKITLLPELGKLL